MHEDMAKVKPQIMLLRWMWFVSIDRLVHVEDMQDMEDSPPGHAGHAGHVTYHYKRSE
jgi:hypothetical protein